MLLRSRWTKAALFSLVPVTVLLFLASTVVMKTRCLSCATVPIAASTTLAHNDAPSMALNTTPTNLVPSPDGRVLYYNATGDVPSYHETSPDPDPITPINSSSILIDSFYVQVLGIATSASFKDSCSQCIAGASVMHLAAITQPVSSFVDLLIRLCNNIPAIKESIYAESCEAQYGSTPNTSVPFSNGAANLGAYYAQLFSKMSIATGDFELFCHNFWSVCEEAPVIGIEEAPYFTPKPDWANTPPPPSGESVNVLHLSDWHIDPRYDIGSEANCTSHPCCRPYSTNTDLHTTSENATVPASRFGSFLCDSPPDLALSSFHSMPQFFDMSNLSFAIFTGDIVSHDRHDQISQSYVSYEEEISYRIFKAALGQVPLYATLGNHDTYPQTLNTQNNLAPNNALSWDYELLSSLWQNASWLNATEAAYASTHYGGYAHTHASGLRIISLNTDFWYKANIFNYWNTTNPDTSGILSFLATELAACESRGQRAWIIGHVPSGYDGSQPLANPTALFYSIVVRFAPATIAGIFFGHTHQQQLQIFYDFLPNSTYTVTTSSSSSSSSSADQDQKPEVKTYRNTTMIDYTKPLITAYIGPSIVPLSDLNAGFTLYQIDAATFEVTGLQTYVADIAHALDWPVAPVWTHEYDARDAYVPFLREAARLGLGLDVGLELERMPLNASFWHALTEVMRVNTRLAALYGLYEVKSSLRAVAAAGGACDSLECARRKACYIRSGSAALGRECG